MDHLLRNVIVLTVNAGIRLNRRAVLIVDGIPHLIGFAVTLNLERILGIIRKSGKEVESGERCNPKI